MKTLYKIAVSVFLFALLSACGGGGGGGGDGDVNGPGGDVSGTTTFAGGSLDDLRALSPSLTFGDLVITGHLSLPINTATTLTVNSLAVTAEGGIGYTYSTCTYSSAPDLTIEATGDVSIEGDISLNGRSGTSVTSGAGCNSCYGQNGGEVSITATNLRIGAQLWNYGGDGGTYRDDYGSSGCRGGDSGHLSLTADNIDLSGIRAETHGGRGGAEGFGYGPSGAPGDVSLIASGDFRMNPGSIRSDGALTFRATQTDIIGPITYGTLDGLINGAADSTLPMASILAPLSGETVSLNQPLEIRIQASDFGMGVREIDIAGFGYSATHSASEMQDGVLTVSLPSLQPDTGLQVTVRDNVLNETPAAVSGLSVSYGAEQEPNDSPGTAQAVSLPVAIAGTISPADGLPPDEGTCDLNIASNYLNTNCIYHTVQDYYTFTVPEGGDYLIELEFDGNGAIDLDLYLDYGDSNGDLWWIYSRDNNATVYREHLQPYLSANVAYTIAIQAWPSWIGTANYRLTIRQVQ